MAKVIKAVFGVGQTTRVCPQWQYDYNTILQFVGLNLPENYEVDLANSKTGQSTTVLGNADGCVIPAQYFIPGTTIYAWVYVVGNDYGFTRAQVEIPISLRAEHTGEEPTPAQQSALDEAIAALNAATEDIQGQIDNALQEAKDSGEFDGADGQDGADGNSIWEYDPNAMASIGSGTDMYFDKAHLLGRTDVEPQIGDIVYYDDPPFNRTKAYQIAEFVVIGGATQCRSTYLNYVTGAKGATGATGATGAAGATLWTTASAPTTSDGSMYFAVSGLSGATGQTAKAGDLVFYGEDYYPVTSVSGGNAYVGAGVNIRKILWTESQVGLLNSVFQNVLFDSSAGGTAASALIASLLTDPEWNSDQLDLLDTVLSHLEYTTPDGGDYADLLMASLRGNTIPAVTIPDPADTTPQALGTAAVGSSTEYARADHVHALPTAAQVGAIAAPGSATSGQFLSWNGSAWVAASLPVYNGGVS